MLNELEIDASRFGHTYADSMNRSQQEYLLPERECLILATGYSIKLRSMIFEGKG